MENSEMSDYIPVVFCCDRNYAPYAAVASYTLCKHTRHKLKLIWLVPVADVPLIEPVLSRLAQMGMRPMVIPVDAAPFAHWKQVGHISVATYIRLLIPDLVPEKKVIYLDADILVLDDLAQLFATDMQGALIGGVENYSGNPNKTALPISLGERYINTGILLMDLDRLREDGFFNRCADINAQYSDDIQLMDQCIINIYADRRKHIFGTRWNFQIKPNLISQVDYQTKFEQIKPAIVHYIGSAKPWQGWCNPPIARLWQHWADQAKIPGVAVAPVTQVTQAMALAQALDLNGDFRQASQLKSSIIQTLTAPVAPKGEADVRT
jgi:lipopolysaccharide biosynthesis glycosyltransferase